jgi:uncharacterized membrane protein YeaQ/YmgE (transglycosylase-associated protein family)
VILVVFIALFVIFVLGSLIWNIFWALFWAVVSGVVFGGLGRLVVPGRNPIGFWPTVACGLVGSFAGAAIGEALDRGWFVTILIEVGLAAAAVAVWSASHRKELAGSRTALDR